MHIFVAAAFPDQEPIQSIPTKSALKQSIQQRPCFTRPSLFKPSRVKARFVVAEITEQATADFVTSRLFSTGFRPSMAHGVISGSNMYTYLTPLCTVPVINGMGACSSRCPCVLAVPEGIQGHGHTCVAGFHSSYAPSLA